MLKQKRRLDAARIDDTNATVFQLCRFIGLELLQRATEIALVGKRLELGPIPKQHESVDLAQRKGRAQRDHRPHARGIADRDSDRTRAMTHGDLSL